jgi:hypothetical protein|tara:strand:- start:1326 stop:1676 length:351 start_codon:yes stop_codon:yes gene_type:complete
LKDGWHVDKKAWSVSNIQKYLKGSAKGDILISGEESTGQLFRDLVAAGNGTKIRWSFDARAGELGVDKIKELVRQGLKENIDDIAQVAKKDISNLDKTDEFIKEVMNNFDIKISDI